MARGSREASSSDEERRNPRNRQWSDVVREGSPRSNSQEESRVEASPRPTSKKGNGNGRSPKGEQQTFTRAKIEALLEEAEKFASPQGTGELERLKTHASCSSKKKQAAHIKAVGDEEAEKLVKRKKVACSECEGLDHISSDYPLGESCRPQKGKAGGLNVGASQGTMRDGDGEAQQEGPLIVQNLLEKRGLHHRLFGGGGAITWGEREFSLHRPEEGSREGAQSGPHHRRLIIKGGGREGTLAEGALKGQRQGAGATRAQTYNIYPRLLIALQTEMQKTTGLAFAVAGDPRVEDIIGGSASSAITSSLGSGAPCYTAEGL